MVTDIEIMLVNNAIPYQRISGKNGLLSDPNAHAYINLLAIIFLGQNIVELPDVLGWLGEDERVLKSLNRQLSNKNVRCFEAIDWAAYGLAQTSTATDMIKNRFNHWKIPAIGHDIISRQKDIANTLVQFISDKQAIRRIFAVVDFISHKITGNTLPDKIIKVLSLLSIAKNSHDEIDRTKVTYTQVTSKCRIQWELKAL
jgi:hypothetical protein